MVPKFAFAFVWTLLLHLQPTVVISFSTPSQQSSPPPPTKYPFRSFEFEPSTGICRKPASFRYTEEKSSDSSIKEDDNDANDTPTQFFVMRNTPGDGDCVFHAVLSSVLISAGILHPDSALFSETTLTSMALEMRNTVAMYLSSPDGTLYVNNKPRKRVIRARDLLRSAARGEGLTKEDYLKRLRLPGKEGGQYGGGPELTVLSNILRRPISIYHLKEQQRATKTTTEDNATAEKNYCELELMGVFGEGLFEDPGQAIPDSVVSNAVFFTMGKSRQQEQQGTQQSSEKVSSSSSWSSLSSPVKCEWHLHILVADTSETEKHATVLLPSVPILHNHR